MNSTGVEADGSRGVFSLDFTVPGAVPGGFDAIRRRWQTQLGDGLPLPSYSPATTADFRVKGRFARLLTFSGCLRVVTLGDPCGMPVLCGTRMVGA
jgi:hypothetical protein